MAAAPEQLGKYRITDTLGEGAMGLVYKGFDPGIQRTVALKTIRSQLAHNDGSGATMAARFRNEAQAAGRLQHPGIVAVYDYGEEDDIAYIAMEYVEGASLAQYLAKGVRFSDDDLVSLMVQLLDALEHAHGRGVWHRDVKPANLLLTQDGRLKVADFGIARIASMQLTQVTSIVGTPAYMAPEQLLGKEIDGRADLYAAGVLLYQLLVGKTPFSGTMESLIYRVVHETPVLPSAVPGHDRPALYDEVLAVALAKAADHRYADAAAFRSALQTAVGRPVPGRVSDDTLILPHMAAAGARAAPPPGTGSTAGIATHWDPQVLGRVETSLARHVGPLASVLVRRTARDCQDLPTLYTRLAEQVSNAAARNAFLAQAGTLSGTAATTAGSSVPPATGSLGGRALDETLVAHSTRLLAQHVGPIASVLAKRAAAKAPSRDVYFALLEEAVSDPAAGTALRAALAKLA